GQKDGGKHVVPTCPGHFARSEYHIGEQELQRDPRHVEDRRGEAALDAFDGDIAEPGPLEFAGERLDLPEGLNYPAVAERAVDGFLRSVKPPVTDESIGDDKAASRTEKTVSFADEARL